MRIIKFLFILFFFTKTLISSDRYICTQDKNNTNVLITNFYIIDKKLFMSGASGNGEYKIINKNKNGLFAVNSSKIGDEFGLETVLIDNINKTFQYKSLISGKRKNNLMKINGYCKKE